MSGHAKQKIAKLFPVFQPPYWISCCICTSGKYGFGRLKIFKKSHKSAF